MKTTQPWLCFLLIFGGRYERYFRDTRLKMYRLPNFYMLFQLLLKSFSKKKVYTKLITWPTIAKRLFSPPFLLRYLGWPSSLLSLSRNQTKASSRLRKRPLNLPRTKNFYSNPIKQETRPKKLNSYLPIKPSWSLWELQEWGNVRCIPWSGKSLHTIFSLRYSWRLHTHIVTRQRFTRPQTWSTW